MRYVAATINLLLLALTWLMPKSTAKVHHIPYRSPMGVAYSPDSRTLAVADCTADEVDLLDASNGLVRARIPAKEPRGLVWSADGSALYAAQASDNILVIDPHTAHVINHLPTGYGATSLALCNGGDALLCTNADSRDVWLLDRKSGHRLALWALPAEPYAVAVANKRQLAVVGRLLSDGDANAVDVGASLTCIDLHTLTTFDIKLPTGSTNVRGIAISPDERWAYVVHCIGNTGLPTTHLDGGWVNNNALSIIDLDARKVYAGVLLDTSEGAADPWGAALTDNGSTLWVALSGVRSAARVDINKLMSRLATRNNRDDNTPLLDTLHQDSAASGITLLGRFTLDLENCISRVNLNGNGPREMAVSPDGRRLAVGLYFEGSIGFVDPTTQKPIRISSLGSAPADNITRRGERIFHDATHTRLTWLSCATCHPDGRADALNWDLLNDGTGNAKNTRSLLNATRRTPLMSHGIRPNAQACVTAGFRYIEFYEPAPGDIDAVKAYISSLKPRRSPFRTPNGSLTPDAVRGKALFDGQAACNSCHTGPMHTDGLIHDVGTRQAWDTSATFATPSLTEVWRTPPYLHDGAAASVLDVITRRNPNDRHGHTRGLSARQVHDLEAYVLSL